MVGLIGLSVVLLIGIGCIHVYWAFGGTWGSNIVLPTRESQQLAFIPGKMAMLVVAFLVFSTALLLIIQGGLSRRFSRSSWLDGDAGHVSPLSV